MSFSRKWGRGVGRGAGQGLTFNFSDFLTSFFFPSSPSSPSLPPPPQKKLSPVGFLRSRICTSGTKAGDPRRSLRVRGRTEQAAGSAWAREAQSMNCLRVYATQRQQTLRPTPQQGPLATSHLQETQHVLRVSMQPRPQQPAVGDVHPGVLSVRMQHVDGS